MLQFKTLDYLYLLFIYISLNFLARRLLDPDSTKNRLQLHQILILIGVKIKIICDSRLHLQSSNVFKKVQDFNTFIKKATVLPSFLYHIINYAFNFLQFSTYATVFVMWNCLLHYFQICPFGFSFHLSYLD